MKRRSRSQPISRKHAGPAPKHDPREMRAARSTPTVELTPSFWRLQALVLLLEALSKVGQPVCGTHRTTLQQSSPFEGRTKLAA